MSQNAVIEIAAALQRLAEISRWPEISLRMEQLMQMSPQRWAPSSEADARHVMGILEQVAAFREALGWDGLRFINGPRGGYTRAVIRADRDVLYVVASLIARRPPAIQPYPSSFPRPAGPPRPARTRKRAQTFSLLCEDRYHSIRWTPDGPIALLHHSRDEVRAAAVLKAMGIQLPECFHELEIMRRAMDPDFIIPKHPVRRAMVYHRRGRIAEKALLRPDPPLLSAILGMADRRLAACALVMAELQALGARFAWVAGPSPADAVFAQDSQKLVLTVHPSLLALARHGIRSDGRRGILLLGASRYGPRRITTVAVDLVRETLLFREIPSPFPFARPLSFHPLETWADWPEGREEGVRIAFEGAGAGWRRWLEALRSAGLQVAIRRLEASLRHQRTEGLLEVRPAPPDRLLAEGCRRGFDVVVSPCQDDENL